MGQEPAASVAVDFSGVTVLELSSALSDHSELIEPYLGSLVPIDRTPLHDLSGTFVHVAAGVHVSEPLQTFFGQQAERMAPESRTLIVAESGSSVAYIEGCSAPIYTPHTDRSSIVEIVVKPGASVRHTTIQNWSTNVVNKIEKHAIVEAGGHVEWVDAVLGSRATATHIVSTLAGATAAASVTSMVSADTGQQHEVDVTMEHKAAHTSSRSLIKMLGSGDGAVTSRHAVTGQVSASAAQSVVESLRLDGSPQLRHQNAADADQRSTESAHLEYLMRRGFSRSEAVALIVGGFIEPITRTLPMEYAVEWERLIELHLDRAIG